MAIQIDGIRSAAAPQIADSAARGLPESDPRRQLVGQPLDQIAAPGTAERQLLGMLHRSISTTSDLSLRDLPFEVAQLILNGRAETMEQFFKSWSESIKLNADLDKKATKKRLLSQMLNRAVNGGALTQAQADQIAGTAGIGSLERAVTAAESGLQRTRQPLPRRGTSPLDALQRPKDR